MIIPLMNVHEVSNDYCPFTAFMNRSPTSRRNLIDLATGCTANTPYYSFDIVSKELILT